MEYIRNKRECLGNGASSIKYHIIRDGGTEYKGRANEWVYYPVGSSWFKRTFKRKNDINKTTLTKLKEMAMQY